MLKGSPYQHILWSGIDDGWDNRLTMEIKDYQEKA